MKYRLKKDLPTAKAGAIFERDDFLTDVYKNKEWYELVEEDNLDERINKYVVVKRSDTGDDYIELIKQLIKDEVKKSLRSLKEKIQSELYISEEGLTDGISVKNIVNRELKRIDQI